MSKVEHENDEEEDIFNEPDDEYGEEPDEESDGEPPEDAKKDAGLAKPTKSVSGSNPEKKEYSSTVEKGTEFELEVAKLFESYGYNVSHNVVLKGKKSGVKHQIDVFAEYPAPLHTTKIIVEAKAYSHPVVKDIVMKLENIRDDIGIDKAILATTIEFTSGAKQTAEQYPLLELWNGDKIDELMSKKGMDTSDMGLLGAEKRFVISKVNPKSINKYATKSAKKRSGGFLFGRGRPKETVASVELVCWPYLDVSVQTRVSRVEKTGWRKKESVVRTMAYHVTMDGRTGALVHFGKKGVSYRFAYLGSLNKDEMAILRQAVGKPTFGKNELILAEVSPSAANAAILKMSSRGIMKQVREKPARYSLLAPVPKTPNSLIGIDKVYGGNMLDTNPGNRIIGLQASTGMINERLNMVWPGCKVISTEQVYYPYYYVLYETSDGDRRNEMLDGITGKPQKYLARVVEGGLE